MSEYLLGTGDEEFERLRFQHEVWRDETEQLWQLAGFGPGQTILDLGSGPGLATVDLATVVGSSGRVVALDASEIYTQLLNKHIVDKGLDHIDVQVGNVYVSDYGTDIFDGVFTRWLLCYLADHDSVVRKVAAALRPGGKLVALDYSNYLAMNLEPKSERFQRIFRKVLQSFHDAGGDLYVGRKLPSVMERFGFVIDDIVPIVRTGRPGSPLWTWVTQFQKSYLPSLVERGYITQQELDEFSLEWQDRARDNRGFFVSPPMVGVVGTKKAEPHQARRSTP